MPVHKKHPADAKAVMGKEEKPAEEIVASDVVIETTGRVEIIEETAPQEIKSEPSSAKATEEQGEKEESIDEKDPLTEFKEKMNEEERDPLDAPAKKNYMWPILLVFIIAILSLTGVFFYRRGININNNEANVAKLSPTPTIAPEPTKTIDLTKYEIEVQNGSEVSGEASRQQTSLEEEGFMVSSIGNADNSDYTDTIIKAKTEVDKDFIAKLKSFLNNSFTVGETETLSEDTSVPVVVIIGIKK